MALLDIHVFGSPILREETTPVAEITDEVQRLIDDMFETMYAAKGIGLAAPQVGRTERLAVIDVDDNPLVVINPEVMRVEGKARAEEGCLSIPEIYGEVERPVHVTVRATDRHGAQFDLDATDLLARCLLHEIDHLHGKLFIDYLSYLRKRAVMKQWEEERAKYIGNIRKLTPEEIAEHHSDEAL